MSSDRPNDTEQVEHVEEIKRGRGRPRKEKVVVEKIKKPLGRPKKEKPPIEETRPKSIVPRGRPKIKPAKIPKTEKIWADDPLAYYRKYYQEKIKVHSICDVCQREFTSICALKYHQKNCKKCQIKKIAQEHGIPEPFNISQ